jgi:hypothetical protein
VAGDQKPSLVLSLTARFCGDRYVSGTAVTCTGARAASTIVADVNFPAGGTRLDVFRINESTPLLFLTSCTSQSLDYARCEHTGAAASVN